MTKLVSIIITGHNSKKWLRGHFGSLAMLTYPNFEVIYVDDVSTDGSADYVKRNLINSFPKPVSILETHEELGFAKATNLAISRCRGEYVMLLNPDTEIEPNCLEELINHIEKDTVAAVAPKMKFLQDKSRINAAGGNCDIYGVGWNRGNGEVDEGQYDALQEVFYGSGGALLIKKQVWYEVGPFDERYFIYQEDLDWCWRARLMGYKVLYIPSAVVYHYWRGSKAPIVYLLERHWLSTILKNYSLRTLIQLMPKYLALKALKTVWLIIYGKSNEKLSIPKGILWNLTNFKGTWRERVRIQMLRKVTDSEIQKYMFTGSFELSLWLRKLKHPILDYYKKEPLKYR